MKSTKQFCYGVICNIKHLASFAVLSTPMPCYRADFLWNVCQHIYFRVSDCKGLIFYDLISICRLFIDSVVPAYFQVASILSILDDKLVENVGDYILRSVKFF